jgi:osmotically-inducible protein OsmY
MADDRNDWNRNRSDFAGRGYGGSNNREAFRDRGDQGSNRDYGAREDYSRRDYGGGDFFGSNRDDQRSRGSSNSDENYGFGGRGGYDEFPRRDYGSSSERSRSYSNQGSSSYYGDNDRDYGRGSYGYGDRSDRFAGDQSGYGGYGSDRSYGGGERGYAQGGRGFWDKASDEVSSWFGDRGAERRRDQDQHRGRGPKGYTRSDERIRDDINDRLTDDGWLDASDIEVSVSNREVTLTGTVSDRNAKRRAEDIAEGISGVSHVQNNLRVKSKDATDVDVDRTANAAIAKTGAGGMR